MTVRERWTIMQAPTGHRFCVVAPKRDFFAESANVWSDDPAPHPPAGE